jgi:thiosulfate/3-mercaptopyruvate sulfurtransferase
MAPDSTVATPALVSVEWLATHHDDPGVRIADVRWYLPHVGKSGRAEYEQGHLPGAVFIDLDTELAGPPGSGPGRHPIPAPDSFSAVMSKAGIGANSHVVAYDDTGGAIAARLWWLLRYFGHERVSVLDGGIAAWRSAGHPLSTDPPAHRETSRFAARPQPNRVVSKESVNQLRTDPRAVILDARAPERYEGRIEPVDARPGHVPGAKNAPFAVNVAPERLTFLEPQQLRRRYEDLGVSPDKTVVAYCGSGVTACQTLLALHLAGYEDGLLYEGSWSDWSKDPSLPAETATTGPS